MTDGSQGERISISGGVLRVPDQPVIPYVEGDGTGRDIWRASQRVFDAAVDEVLSEAGGRSPGTRSWPARRPSTHRRSGCPRRRWRRSATAWSGSRARSTTPIGGGIRSLNVALRQDLDLYVCLRPVRWFQGVPSPVKRPQDVDMVIFRENTEDIYAGVEWAAGTPEVKKVLAFLQGEMKVKKIRFPETSGIGIKPISREGTERLVRAAIRFAIAEKRKSVTLVHKGNIMKYTEGAFRDWGYARGHPRVPRTRR